MRSLTGRGLSRQRRSSQWWGVLSSLVALATFVSFSGPAGAVLPMWHLTKVFVSPIQTMTGVDCSSTTHCVATTTNGRVGSTTNAWSTFSSVAARGAHYADQMDAVSCPSALKCEAVGTWGTSTTGYGVVVSSTNGGHSWSTQHSLPVPHSLAAISCPTVSVCMAVGVMGGHTEYWIRTIDGGAHWSDHTGTIDPSIGGLSSVSCVSALTCTVIGIRGEGAITNNGGTTWTVGNAFSTVNWLYGVSCIGKGVCYAVGEDTKGQGLNLYSPNGGQTWRQMTSPNGIAHEYGVSCVDTTHCFAVGQSVTGHGVVLHISSPTAWATSSIPSGSTVLNAIRCRATNWCTAVGGNLSNDAVVMTLHS